MADLGLLYLTELQKLALSQQQNQLNPNLSPSPWMWNPKQAHQEEDSWEVRAFAEDTANAMGTTWPPRSYTCTFCRREFRSAQALGGHMNVHRRDRARLHQAHPNNPAAVSSSTSSLIISTQEFVTANGGLCLLYQLPSPNIGAAAAFMTTPTSAFNSSSCCQSSSPSTLLSMLPSNPPDYLMSFPVVPQRSTNSSSHCHSNRSLAHEKPSTSGNDHNDNEELDLELRLGHGPTLPS